MLAAEIAEADAACRRSTADAIRHAIEAGHRLIEAKRLVPYGQWMTWLRASMPTISVRTARRYMAAADRAGENASVSFFRMRDLVRPVRERFGWLDRRHIVVLTPSTNSGFTYVTVIETETWAASGFLLPVRDDAIDRLLRAFYGANYPSTWSTRRSVQHRENPWLADAERVADPHLIQIIDEIVAAADLRLDAMGFAGPPSLHPESRA
ncbi:MAG: DUF3102 domain-containing protein [Geminicoccaceae bacterium]